ncbi:MAG: phosphotransferase [Magnetococcales bacterium]|nr:phosphotransferase [Magnetococcales bacterium]
MGVIRKVLYRGQILGKPRHRNLFLDMEENIHIHYRDLRIELSRGEFEDICAAFGRQSLELQAIIHEKHYQDGKLANANQDDVRIWTESQLKHEVRYHPRRFSLEECSDGFHLHYRNFKLLIDEPDFRQLVQLFKTIDVDGPCAATYAEVLELLEANDLDFMLDAGNLPDEVLALSVASYHLPKIREIFKLIGFSQAQQVDGSVYQGTRLKVVVKGDQQTATHDYQRLRGLNHTQRLADFLARSGNGLEPNLLNRIKCQVLDLYYALKTSQQLPVETDPQGWLYAPATEQVIFPYALQTRDGPQAAKTLYKSWSGLLARLGLSFVKPGKARFATREQESLQQQVTTTLRNEVAACGAVERVYLMGSALRREMGRYQTPFVHGPQAKLGSDVDILVELRDGQENGIPATWQLINPESSSGCAVYHITQIPLAAGAGEWTTRHPHIPFTHHLVDAYLFFPSRGQGEKKEAFLRKFGAVLFYDRNRDGVILREGVEERIARQIAARYPLSGVVVEPMRVATENLLYKVTAHEREAILKLFKVAGNYRRNRVAEHTRYEAGLVDALISRGVKTAGVVPTVTGEPVTVEDLPALLFDRINGAPQSKPEYALEIICPALATLHRVQLDAPMGLREDFSFEDTCQIWLPYFDTYRRDPALPPTMRPFFDRLAPLATPCLESDWRRSLYATSPALHCHGDVTPKNVIIDPEGTVCFFDFNNCFHGPRMIDLLDGGFEFSLADKYIHLADFARFDRFLAHYARHFPLTDGESQHLLLWIHLLGVIKFTKEIRVLLERPQEELRRQRAVAIAEFLLARQVRSS